MESDSMIAAKDITTMSKSLIPTKWKFIKYKVVTSTILSTYLSTVSLSGVTSTPAAHSAKTGLGLLLVKVRY